MTGVLDLFRLDGQKAVVTGSGKGIGRGIAIAMAQAGADVLVTARSQADVDETAAAVRACGRRSAAIAIDVTQDGAMEKIGDLAVETFGGLTIWINNAGGLPGATPRTFRKTPKDAWDAQIALNFTAPWRGAVAAADRMKEGGSIINISSRGSFGAHPKNGPYTSAKAAVSSMTGTMAVEMAPKIRVNAVAPGGVMTQNLKESIDNGVPEAMREAFVKSVVPPLGRLGEPEDIGAACVYLASPAARWVTGIVLHVNGGAGGDV
jgi:7-alpha-hydroxysteroid dehydrogenase